MELKLNFNALSIKDDSEEKKQRAAQAKQKKKDANETIEEAFERLSELKYDDKEAELFKLAKKGYFAGDIGRLETGKMNKGEVLSMGRILKEKREAAEKELRIRSTIENKPEGFYILTKDSELPAFVARLREECRLQMEQWTNRWDMLGVKSMMAGDMEGTGIDAYIDLSIGFSIWLPLLDEGYYLPYGHVDVKHLDGFDHVPREYAFKEDDEQLTRSKVLEHITPYLSNPDHGKSFHMGSARYDLHIAKNDGYSIKGLRWDSLDAMYHLSEHIPKYGLKPLTERFGKYYGIEKEVHTFEDLFGNTSPAPYNTEIVGIYAIYDVYYGWKLTEWQFEKMKSTNNLLNCYAEIDSKIPEVDVQMARAGFRIDLEELAKMEQEFENKIEEARANVIKAYGIDDNFLYDMSMSLNGAKIQLWKEKQQKKINRTRERLDKAAQTIGECEKQGKTKLKKYTQALDRYEKYEKELESMSDVKPQNAPDYIHSFEFTNGNHLGYLIYDFLEIEDKTPKVKKGKTRSTAADVLEMYYEDEEALKPLATVAEYAKLLNTYVRKIPEALEIDGRFHTEWKAGGTSTGRYSSSAYRGRRVDILDEFIEGGSV